MTEELYCYTCGNFNWVDGLIPLPECVICGTEMTPTDPEVRELLNNE